MLDERLNDFIKLWKHYAPEESDNLIIHNEKLMKYLKESFFTSPASTKYHGAYEGGLYDHSKQVFLRLQELTERNGLSWQRNESPFIVGMLHDICKCDQYIKTNEGYQYNNNTLLKGHGSKSILILSQYINLTEEEMLCIRLHMGAYEQDDWDMFDKAIKKYPNVLWTHTADMLASKVDDV